MPVQGKNEGHKAASPTAAGHRRKKIAHAAQTAVVALTLVAIPGAWTTAAPGSHESSGSSGSSEPAARSVAAVGARPIALLENRRILSYPMDQVWTTAIRYLRIDRGFEVVDRDQEAGYMLFEFPVDGGGTGSGSLEMFPTTDDSGRDSVSVAVSTGAGPLHLPNTILDGLAAKVRAERGQPAPPKPDAPQDDPPDDDGEQDGDVPLLPPAIDP